MPHCTSHLAAALAALAFAAPGFAQQLRFNMNEPEAAEIDCPALAVFEEPIYFEVSGGFAHQFDADLDVGDYHVSRLDFAASAETDLNETWEVALQLRTWLDSFDFAPNASLGFGSEPWEDIFTLSLGARIHYKLNDRWTLIGGPVLQFSRESGADWGDSLTGGGALSALYHWNENLAVGLGIGVLSQLEDDVIFFPILLVEWKLSSTLRLSSDTPTTTSVGGEIVWEFAPTFEAALGGGYSSKRFRLDDAGLAPGGVGEETYFPVHVRLGWSPVEHVQVNIFGGFALGTELTIETSTGAFVNDEEPDAAMFAGFSASLQF